MAIKPTLDLIQPSFASDEAGVFVKFHSQDTTETNFGTSFLSLVLIAAVEAPVACNGYHNLPPSSDFHPGSERPTRQSGMPRA